MDRFHFSTAECFENCPANFDFRYRQGLETIPSDDPQNALFLGTALHRAMETDMETAIQEYLMNYPVMTDEHINEVIKLEHWIPKLKAMLPEGLHEVNFKNDVYEGTADLLVPCTKHDLNLPCGQFDLYDFKYSNNIEHYMESRQLHVYKYYLEQITGKHIRKMFFVFVPKVKIKQGKTETLFEFRKRIQQELNQLEIQIKEVQFNQMKVDEFHQSCMKIGLTQTFKKNPTYLCGWCNYKDYCQKGNEIMILPSTERRQVGKTTKRKLWIYGQPFSGKTTFLDSAPDPLNLNTDGNIQFVTMPVVPINDTMEGRQKILAWNVFKDAVDTLQKSANENGFKTLIVDLVDDIYQMCRKAECDRMGITHESDDSFKAWDIIRQEFLNTIRTLFSLPYENIILVSHEDTSKDIMKKSGDKITSIKPNIPDKVANKLAGMVDIVARVVVQDDGSRTLDFKSNEVIFGGGRMKGITKTSIELSWDALMKVYDEANGSISDDLKEAPEQPKEAHSGRKARKTSPEAEKPQEEAQEEVTAGVAEVDGYYHLKDSDNYVKIHGGDVIPDDAEAITEDEFKAGLKKIAQGDVQTPPTRTRRTRKERS